MKNFIFIVTLFLISSLSYNVQARNNDAVGKGPNPYTDCGIGAALFPQTHWAAVLSNATWDLGVTAIISAVSSPHTCTAVKMKTAKVIIETLPDLEKDIAMGSGKYTVALADTMNCSAQHDIVSADIRNQYKDAVSNTNYSSQDNINRATVLYNIAREAAIDAGCGTGII